MRGEYENMKGEVQKIDNTPKPIEVTTEDINILKRMIFEMKDFTIATDNFVRQNLLTKLEINNTSIEDVNQTIKNLNNKYVMYKTTSEKFESNIREQLDIIQSLNGKINATNEQQLKFKQDIFDRFVSLSEELMSKQGKEDMDRTNRVIELTERFEKSMQESFDEIMAFKKDFQKYRDEKENEVSELDEKYGSLTKETLNRVNEFEKTITLNVGGMLKDLNDIKLQLTSSFQRSAS